MPEFIKPIIAEPLSRPPALDAGATTMPNPAFNEVVTLVVKHRIKAGSEAWLRRIVSIASGYPGHLGVDIVRSKSAGLQMFTCVLRFCSTDAMQSWLDSEERGRLVEEAIPMLADGDQTEVNRRSEFWFSPAPENSAPPRWKQSCVTFLVILPLTLLVPLVWRPVFGLSPWLANYVVSTFLVTITVVLLVVYLLMPFATRLFAPWLSAQKRNADEASGDKH